MEPGISIVTPGVSDLNRSIIFCRDGLGLPTIFKEAENIAFFQLKGTSLVLYPSDALAEDACPPPQRACFSGISLAHNGRSKDQANKVISQALAAGEQMLKPAADPIRGGYTGYFFRPEWPPLGSCLESIHTTGVKHG